MSNNIENLVHQFVVNWLFAKKKKWFAMARISFFDFKSSFLIFMCTYSNSLSCTNYQKIETAILLGSEDKSMLSNKED